MDTTKKIRVAIVDDDASMREGLKGIFGFYKDLEVVGEFKDAANIGDGISACHPDIVLMDLDLEMPDMDGIKATAIIKTVFPSAHIIIWTRHEDNAKVFDAIKVGASGYLLKGTDYERIVDSIRSTHAGGSSINTFIARKVLEFFQGALKDRVLPRGEQNVYRLTKREIEVLGLLREGCSYKEVGERLFIGMDAVRSHIRNIYEKMHVHSKTKAVLRAIEQGII
jgi:DNA-binding NarL/FixJ family response regulator